VLRNPVCGFSGGQFKLADGMGLSAGANPAILTTMENQSDTNSTEPHATIKLGIDAHAKWYYVARQIDGATPQPVQKMTLAVCSNCSQLAFRTRPPTSHWSAWDGGGSAPFPPKARGRWGLGAPIDGYHASCAKWRRSDTCPPPWPRIVVQNARYAQTPKRTLPAVPPAQTPARRHRSSKSSLLCSYKQ
jgi:hypothetical protein